MPLIIPIPADLSDAIAMADWIELVALVADDHNSGRGDLDQAIRQAGTFDGMNVLLDEAIDAFCLSVFSTLENRSKLLGQNYPFEINGGLISRKPEFTLPLLPYVFCLCLSYFGDRARSKELDPRLMFEELSAYAASSYLGGEHLIFGTSRSKPGKQSKGFRAAVTNLCQFVGEGEGFRDQSSLSKKDDHVDIVAVKHFEDKATGKIILFGQCASGDNWKSKISEMQPKHFWDQWMQVSNVSQLLRSFFIPFSVVPKDWDYHARYGGLFFDRLRIARWASTNVQMESNSHRFSAWIDDCLNSLA